MSSKDVTFTPRGSFVARAAFLFGGRRYAVGDAVDLSGRKDSEIWGLYHAGRIKNDTDSKLVAFRATPGERVDVSPPSNTPRGKRYHKKRR